MEDHALKNVRNFCGKLVGEDTFEDKGRGQLEEKRPFTGWGKAKNVSLWTAYLTFDIMGDLCFSHSFDMLESSKNHFMLQVLPACVQGLNIVRHRLLFHVKGLITVILTDRPYARPCQPPPR